MLLFSSPVGTAALINYFAGMAPDYRASAGMVAFINGWVNGLVTAVGSLIGGYLCDRYSRRAMYLLSGGLTALCGGGDGGRADVADDLRHRRQRVPARSPASATPRSRRRCSRPSARAAPRRRRSTRCSCRAATAPSATSASSTRASTKATARAACSASTPRINVAGIIALYFLFRWFGGFRKRARRRLHDPREGGDVSRALSRASTSRRATRASRTFCSRRWCRSPSSAGAQRRCARRRGGSS